MFKEKYKIISFIWLFSLTALFLFFALSGHKNNIKFGTYTPSTILHICDSSFTNFKDRPHYDSLRTFLGDTATPWDSTYSRAYLIPWGDSSTAGVFEPIAYGPVIIDSFAPIKTRDTLVLKVVLFLK